MRELAFGKAIHKVVLSWAAIGFFCCGLGCGQSSKPIVAEGGGGSEKPGKEDLDKRCRELLAAKEECAEARAWLSPKYSNHILWKGDKRRVTELVDGLYQAGAADVQAVGLVKEEQVEIAALFVATLPDEPEMRAKLFALESAFWKELQADEEVQPDVGQHYLEFNLDL